jgi:DNA-binding winged helix-turn-helix (wHTH) protein/TolB-like protein
MDHQISAEFPPMSGNTPPEITATPTEAVALLRFDDFEFDFRRSELRRRNGAPVALRPKAELLLRLLLSQPGRLLGRDYLLASIWPGTVVTDDSLVQCVGELRKALDDHHQRLIRTVLRRGYRMDAQIEPLVSAPVSGPRVRLFRIGAPIARWSAAVLVAALGGAGIWYFGFINSRLHIDSALAARHTIAVMPFEFGDAEPRLRTAAKALSDQIAAQISLNAGMRSIGRTSTAVFDASAPRLAQIASELHASYVVTGRVLVEPSGLPLSIELDALSTSDGTVIWTGHFLMKDATDGRLVPEIGQQVTSALRNRLNEIDSAFALRPGHKPDAVDLVMLATHDLDVRSSTENVRLARLRFRQALREDSESVVAWNGLGASYLLEQTPQKLLSAEDLSEAEGAIERANKLAPYDAEPKAQWGVLQLGKGRADLALAALDKAIQTDSSIAVYHVRRAEALLMLGRIDEVIPETDRAIRLGMAARDGPRISMACFFGAEAALMNGDDETAYALVQRAIVERPSAASPYALLAALDALRGRKKESASELSLFKGLWPSATIATYEAWRPSSNLVYLSHRARLYEGLRLAGLAEK